jgi:lysophospholipase L1-like esterase
MGGLGSINRWLGAGLSAPDRIHLSGKGYRLQGDLLYDALVNSYGDYYATKQSNSKNKR